MIRKFFKRKLTEGQGVCIPGFAEGLNRMANAIERAEFVNGNIELTNLGGLKLTYLGAGDVTSSYPKPFDLTFEFDEVSKDTTATLSNLYYLMSTVQMYQSGEISGAMTAHDLLYIGYKLTLSNGLIEILIGENQSDVSDITAPAPNTTSIKRALYKCESVINGDGDRIWSVALDMRSQPVNVLRV